MSSEPNSALVVGLDHVQLAAPEGCEGEARSFFGELLGLPELAKPAALAGRGGVWFGLGAQQLHIGTERRFSPAQKAHPALSVDPVRLDELARRLARAGHQPVWDQSLPGVRRFYAADPWGNRLEFVAAAGSGTRPAGRRAAAMTGPPPAAELRL